MTDTELIDLIAEQKLELYWHKGRKVWQVWMFSSDSPAIAASPDLRDALVKAIPIIVAQKLHPSFNKDE